LFPTSVCFLPIYFYASAGFHIVCSLVVNMDIELVKCACCGLKEDCTKEYIENVKGNFRGKWLCGLCSEAVGDELGRDRSSQSGVEEAIKAHMAFCMMPLSSPAVRIADGMKRMLRRRSRDKMSPATPSEPSSF
jgi:hypothetical protein